MSLNKKFTSTKRLILMMIPLTNLQLVYALLEHENYGFLLIQLRGTEKMTSRIRIWSPTTLLSRVK